MSGFPTRFIRSQLGPKLRDNYPVENPETDVGAATFDAAFWQVAGMNLIAPRASVVAQWNGTSFDKAHQAEAWNADGDQTHPVLARTSAGVYTYTFAPTYMDENGVAIATELSTARATVNAVLTAFGDYVVAGAWKDTGNPLVIQVRLFRIDGVAVDEPFWLEVL